MLVALGHEVGHPGPRLHVKAGLEVNQAIALNETNHAAGDLEDRIHRSNLDRISFHHPFAVGAVDEVYFQLEAVGVPIGIGIPVVFDEGFNLRSTLGSTGSVEEPGPRHNTDDGDLLVARSRNDGRIGIHARLVATGIQTVPVIPPLGRVSQDIFKVRRGEGKPCLVKRNVVGAVERVYLDQPLDCPSAFTRQEKLSRSGVAKCGPGDLVANFGVLRAGGREITDDNVERPAILEVSEEIVEGGCPRSGPCRHDPDRLDADADVGGGSAGFLRTGLGRNPSSRRSSDLALTTGQTR